MGTPLSPHRKVRVLTVGIAASVSLYALALVLAEPLRGFAATDSDIVAVTLTIGSAITNTCDATNVSLGTINGTGDSGVYSASRDTACTIITNNATGYTLSWLVATGTGA